MCGYGVHGSGTLQHTAKPSLQHTAVHCNTLRHTDCNTLQHSVGVDVENTLQHTATHGNIHCNAMLRPATHCDTDCITLQHGTGVDVECTAVARPDVDVTKVEALAMSLGARTFRTRSFIT